MTVADYIIKIRRFAKDLPILTSEKFDGDASTTIFRLKYTPVIEASYTVKISGVTKTETTDYTIDRDTGVVTFVVAPASASDNVQINYKYAKFSDTEYLDILNSVIQELRTKVWADKEDTTTLTTVSGQEDYSLNTISTRIFRVIALFSRFNSSVDWSSVSTDTNVKYLREQNSINLRPSIQASGYLLKLRYLEYYDDYSATTDTIVIPDRFLDAILYFCMSKYFDRLIAQTVTTIGASAKEPTYEATNNLINVRVTMEREGNKLLARVKPRTPSGNIQNIHQGVKY